jgi:hypothetical protein
MNSGTVQGTSHPDHLPVDDCPQWTVSTRSGTVQPTHLGDKGVPLQLIMAKTRHRNPRTVMRYVKPGAEAVAEVTQLLEPPKSRG